MSLLGVPETSPAILTGAESPPPPPPPQQTPYPPHLTVLFVGPSWSGRREACIWCGSCLNLLLLHCQDHSAFKNHLRDFLVQTKQFASQDNADLYAEEAAAKAAAERERLSQAVPGIVPPNERQDEMTDA